MSVLATLLLYFLCSLEDRKGQSVRMLHLPKASIFVAWFFYDILQLIVLYSIWAFGPRDDPASVRSDYRWPVHRLSLLSVRHAEHRSHMASAQLFSLVIQKPMPTCPMPWQWNEPATSWSRVREHRGREQQWRVACGSAVGWPLYSIIQQLYNRYTAAHCRATCHTSLLLPPSHLPLLS